MPVSLDVLNTNLNDLKGPLLMTFKEKTPLFDWMNKRKKINPTKAPQIERLLVGSAPVALDAVRTGGETFDTTRTENIKKLYVGTQRFAGAIAIPGLDLETNDGPLGAIKLIKEYPAAVIAAHAMALDRFFLTGVSGNAVLSTAACQGWNTLNGDAVFATGIPGVTNGLIDFAAPSAQTDTVQGLAKSTAYNYVNQYGDIVGGYAASGRYTFGKTYRACSKSSTLGPNTGPDICFADDETYANIEKEDLTRVRTTVVQGDIDKDLSAMRRVFLNMELVAAQNMVLTDFTTAAALNGVAYLLSSQGIEMHVFKEFNITPFEDRIANQDNVVAKMLGQFGIVVPNMAVHGAVTGGAVA